jgi:signal transduction histidine kinase
MGLANLRARVETLGGNFNVRSEAGKGTTLTAILPR